MRHYLFNCVAAVSLAILASAVALWVDSYWNETIWRVPIDSVYVAGRSVSGRITIRWAARALPSLPPATSLQDFAGFGYQTGTHVFLWATQRLPAEPREIDGPFRWGTAIWFPYWFVMLVAIPLPLCWLGKRWARRHPKSLGFAVVADLHVKPEV